MVDFKINKDLFFNYHNSTNFVLSLIVGTGSIIYPSSSTLTLQKAIKVS